MNVGVKSQPIIRSERIIRQFRLGPVISLSQCPQAALPLPRNSIKTVDAATLHREDDVRRRLNCCYPGTVQGLPGSDMQDALHCQEPKLVPFEALPSVYIGGVQRA